MKTRMLVTTLIAMLVLVVQLLAQPPQCRPIHGDDPQMHPDLNLTTEQLNTFKKMRLEFRKEMLPLKNEIEAKNLELQSLLISGKPDEGKIDAVIEDIGKLRIKVQKKQVAHRLAMREQLTDDQKAIWDAMPKGPGMRGMKRGHQGCCNDFGPPQYGKHPHWDSYR